MTFKDLFNKNKKDHYLAEHSERISSNFRSASLQLKAIIEDELGPCRNQLNGWRKNTMGYRGIGFNSGIYSGLRTKGSLVVPSSNYVYDHVIGATLCGQTAEEIIIGESFDLDYLVKEWLFDNLYLWATIKVTKEEHKKENILRNKNTLNEKNLLMHYRKVFLEDLCED